MIGSWCWWFCLLFDLEHDQIIETDNLCDLKESKDFYQLSRSQFVFTIVQRKNQPINFISFPNTSVLSTIMTEEIPVGSSLLDHWSFLFDQQSLLFLDIPRNHWAKPIENQFQCIPHSGSYDGGDNIVLFLPQPIKNNSWVHRNIWSKYHYFVVFFSLEYTIAFEFGQNDLQLIETTRMDTRTILFQTPKYPYPIRDQQLKVSIIIRRNQVLLSTIDFFYIACMPLTCSREICNDVFC